MQKCQVWSIKYQVCQNEVKCKTVGEKFLRFLTNFKNAKSNCIIFFEMLLPVKVAAEFLLMQLVSNGLLATSCRVVVAYVLSDRPSELTVTARQRHGVYRICTSLSSHACIDRLIQAEARSTLCYACYPTEYCCLFNSRFCSFISGRSAAMICTGF